MIFHFITFKNKILWQDYRKLLWMGFLIIAFIMLSPLITSAYQVGLSWNPSISDVDGYRAFIREEWDTYNYDDPEWEGSATTCAIDGLAEGIDYCFVVRAFNEYGESENSNEARTSDYDIDGDRVNDFQDSCPFNYNPDQEDSDGDGCGDVCDGRPDDSKWVTIAGFISLTDGTPVVAMMLANGQHNYSNNPVGEYTLDVPLNTDGEITLYAFCGGQEPFKVILTHSEALCYEIFLEAASPDSKEMIVTVEMEESTLKSGWVHISGQVTTEDETPFVAMVLANGQKQFSNNPVGEYALDVPLNPDGQITLYVFGGGQAPFKTILPFN